MDFIYHAFNWLWSILAKGFYVWSWLIYVIICIFFVLPLLLVMMTWILVPIYVLVSGVWKHFKKSSTPTKIITSICLYLIVIFGFTIIYKVSNRSIAKNQQSSRIKEIVDLGIREYKSGGMSALRSLSENNYATVSKNLNFRSIEKCAVIDILANLIDTHMSTKYKFPRDEYFSLIQFQVRIRPHLMKAGMSMEDANKNINHWEREVRKDISSSKELGK